MILHEDILAQHIAILGKTGSGKTYLAKLIVERLLEAKERVCIIDPTGVWWGLRSNAKGTGPGFPVVVFGGQHQDVPLAEAHGSTIAEIVGTTATPAILDTRLMTVGARTRFFTDFAETLLRKNAGPLHIVIDEAHLFAPQGRVADPRSGQMLHAANNLVSLGRGVGLRIIMISQRPAKLHKDSLTQVETLIALRLIAPQDRRAVEDWIGEWADPKEGKELLASLPSLKTGTGWVWAPEVGLLERKTFPRIKTYDSSRAPTGDSGSGPVLAPIDLPLIQAKLGAVAEEAKANDPKALRARIAELERAARAPAPNIEAARQEGYQAGFAAGTNRQAAEDNERIAAMRRAIDAATGYLVPFIEAPDGGVPVVTVRRVPAPPIIEHAGVAQPAERRNLTPKVGGSSPPARAKMNGSTAHGITGPMQKILDALAWWGAIGVHEPSRVQVAVVAGYSPSGGAFQNPLGTLRTSGLIEYPRGGAVTLTAAGGAVAAAPDAPPNEADLHSRVMAILDGPRQRILQPLLQSYPRAMTRDELANAAGYEPTGGAFQNPLGALRSLGLVDYPERGQVVALPLLFLH